MALNIARYRRKQQRALGGAGDFWRPKPLPAHNAIRVFAFQHVVTEHDFERGLYLPGEVEVGQTEEEIDVPVRVHFGPDGPELCSGRDTCHYCQELATIEASGAKISRDDRRQLGFRRQFVMNVVDMAEPDRMQLYWATPAVYNEIISYATDDEYQEQEVLGPDGRDFVVNYNAAATLPVDYYDVKLRDREKSESLDGSFNDHVVDLYDYGRADPTSPEARTTAGPVAEEQEPAVEDTPAAPATPAPAGAPAAPAEDGDLDAVTGEIGKVVSFGNDDGNTLVGEVVSTLLNDKGEVNMRVNVEGELWDVAPNDCTVVPAAEETAEEADAPKKPKRASASAKPKPGGAKGKTTTKPAGKATKPKPKPKSRR